MGLNDEDDAEFGPMPDDTSNPTIVAQPQKRQAPNDITEKDLFGEDVVAGQLPKMDPEFEYQTVAGRRLVDLQSLQSRLKITGKICMEDAQAIDAAAPGFLNDDNPVEYFTETPTKTNLDASMNSIDGEMDRQYQDLSVKVSELAADLAAKAREAQTANRGKYVQCLIGINKALMDLINRSGKEDVTQVPHFFSNDSRWSKISRTPMSDIIDTSVPSDEFYTAQFAHIKDSSLHPHFEKLRDLFSDHDFRQNMWILSRPSQALNQIWINGFLNIMGTDGQVRPLEQKLDDGSGTYFASADTLAGYIMAVGNSRVRDWTVLVNNVILGRIAILEKTPAQIQEINTQEAGLSDKTERVLDMASLNTVSREELVSLFTTVGKVYQFMCVLTDIINQICPGQTPN